MIQVSNADRVVFPDVGKTKGDVVAYYERVAERALPHLAGRPLSIRRYPKGLAGGGFFQKNVPAHYPASIARFAVPRSREATRKHGSDAPAFTKYPVVSAPEHLPYVANQGAIELHVPTSRVEHLHRPDRIVIDLDPPPNALARVRRMALVVRDALAELGLPSTPMATGSKGYHVIARILPTVDVDALATTIHKFATLIAARHPDDLTVVFRVAHRGERVFVDWLRNTPIASVVAPYSLRATPRATVATPLEWHEVETIAPDGFTLDDAARLLDRPDTLAASPPSDAGPFCAAVDDAFARAGLVLETFDRFHG